MKMMKKATAVILAAAMAAALTACGGGEKAETTAADTKAETTAAKEDAKGAESPAEETKAGEEAAAGGTILMATNAEFEPWEFHDGDAIVGIDPENTGLWLYALDCDGSSPIARKLEKYISRAGDKAKLKKRVDELENENRVLRSLLRK